MYKVRIFKGLPEQLEEFLNSDELKDLTLKTCTQTNPHTYLLIFWWYQPQKLSSNILENLCADCLTCSAFAYACGGSSQKCDKWEEDLKAYTRVNAGVVC